MSNPVCLEYRNPSTGVRRVNRSRTDLASRLALGPGTPVLLFGLIDDLVGELGIERAYI
jgi:hypothetical protein